MGIQYFGGYKISCDTGSEYGQVGELLPRLGLSRAIQSRWLSSWSCAGTSVLYLYRSMAGNIGELVAVARYGGDPPVSYTRTDFAKLFSALAAMERIRCRI